jgi:hypothetical protein
MGEREETMNAKNGARPGLLAKVPFVVGVFLAVSAAPVWAADYNAMVDPVGQVVDGVAYVTVTVSWSAPPDEHFSVSVSVRQGKKEGATLFFYKPAGAVAGSFTKTVAVTDGTGGRFRAGDVNVLGEIVGYVYRDIPTTSEPFSATVKLVR